MNYEKIYCALIEKRKIKQLNKKECYCEWHHIKPRSIFPELSKDKSNLILLTSKEHYTAHHLLMRWYKEKYRRKSCLLYKNDVCIFIYH